MFQMLGREGVMQMAEMGHAQLGVVATSGVMVDEAPLLQSVAIGTPCGVSMRKVAWPTNVRLTSTPGARQPRRAEPLVRLFNPGQLSARLRPLGLDTQANDRSCRTKALCQRCH